MSALKHGFSQSIIYKRYMAMKGRCENIILYPTYKDRNICEEWKNDIEAFISWSYSNGFEEHLTLDRVDNNGDYEPSNCQWITKEENARKESIGKFKFNILEEQEMILLYSEGLSLRKIAVEYNTNHAIISRVMQRNNIDIIKRTNNKQT